MNDAPLSESLREIEDQLRVARGGLRSLPRQHPDWEVGRAYSLALTKLDEALMWINSARETYLGNQP